MGAGMADSPVSAQMHSLDDLDLIIQYAEGCFLPTAKVLANFRAQLVLDISPFRALRDFAASKPGELV